MSFGNYYVDCLVRIGCSFICGLLLGIERKTRQHPVGLRTLILISVSSTLLSIFSVFIANNPQFPGDPTRVAAGVVTGIGFLGGGAILHQGLNIKGLTSAAVIWTAAALGLACGTGQFFVAGITLFVALFSLVVLEKIEYKLFPAEKSKTLTLIYSEKNINLDSLQNIIAEHGLIQSDLNMTESLKENKIILKFSVKAPGELNIFVLTEQLMKTGNLTKISISDD